MSLSDFTSIHPHAATPNNCCKPRQQHSNIGTMHVWRMDVCIVRPFGDSWPQWAILAMSDFGWLTHMKESRQSMPSYWHNSSLCFVSPWNLGSGKQRASRWQDTYNIKATGETWGERSTDSGEWCGRKDSPTRCLAAIVWSVNFSLLVIVL